LSNPVLGLRENIVQFTILVIVNAFVGGMIGLERSIFPAFAGEVFGVSSHSAMLSFITAFGLAKALTNYFTGKLANIFGRKNLLIAGWIIALPIPFLLISANSWSVVILSNVLLGISQGLTWSSTVVMKIDLVGERERGLAMGLNEFAGYFAVGIVALATGWVANQYGVTPYPFYIGIAISVLGLMMSIFLVEDTGRHAATEQISSDVRHMDNVFMETTFHNKTLSAVTQAGLVNNLNDGMIWGLLPVLLMLFSYNTQEIGWLTALYPATWGIAQLLTGKMSDVYSKKRMLFSGMLMQGLAILMIPLSEKFLLLAFLSIALGLGTALVYPTFLSTIAQHTSPVQRAESIGTFRLWRDLGYAIGAIVSGVVSDVLGVEYAIILIGVLTVMSSIVIQVRMPSSEK
jgi:MFS family permease